MNNKIWPLTIKEPNTNLNNFRMAGPAKQEVCREKLTQRLR